MNAHKLKSSNILKVVNLTVLTAPFLFYGWFIHRNLIPVEYPDSYAYLWRQPFNFYFLTGRSLTQRILFSLCFTRSDIIPYVQLLFYFSAALIMYKFLSHSRSLLSQFFISIIVALIFSSYTLNLSSLVIGPEPIFISMLITFPLVLFSPHDKYSNIAVTATGVFFIFSKNVAPYACISLLFFRMVTSKNYEIKRTLISTTLLLLISTVSILVTMKYDTSIHINVVNIIYREVFPYPEKVSYFNKKYEMPVGSLVEQCKGKWIGEPCSGMHFFWVDPKTRNLTLMEELPDILRQSGITYQQWVYLSKVLENSKGFIRWVKTRGQRAWLHYLLFVSPERTYSIFKQKFLFIAEGRAIRFMTEYLGKEIPTNNPNNLVSIVGPNPKKEIGFGGFDSLTIILNILLKLGFGYVEMIFLYIIGGIILVHSVNFSSYLSYGTSMLASSLILFFVCYFGDAIEIRRHVFPALIMLVFSGGIYLFSLIEIFFHQTGLRSIAVRALNRMSLRHIFQ